MEKKLKELFEYQRFEHNGKLDKMINETENRYGKELSDDDLSLVNAAGTGEEYVGGIVGTSEGGTINNCYNSGNVEGAEFVGGNGGASNGGAIYDYIGGIAGKNYSKNDVH